MDSTITELIKQLSSQMGVAVEYLWESLYTQQYSFGVKSILVGIVYLVFVYVIIKGYGRKILIFPLIEEHVKIREEYNYSYRGDFLSMIIHASYFVEGAVILLFVFTGVTNITNGIMRFMNPGYYVLENIKELLTKIN